MRIRFAFFAAALGLTLSACQPPAEETPGSAQPPAAAEAVASAPDAASGEAAATDMTPMEPITTPEPSDAGRFAESAARDEARMAADKAGR